jgi:hypothetical protein
MGDFVGPWVRFLTGYKVGLIEGDTAGELVVGLGVLNVGASLVSVEIVGDFVGFWVGLFMGYKVGLLEGDSVGGLSTVMASEHESII